MVDSGQLFFQVRGVFARHVTTRHASGREVFSPGVHVAPGQVIRVILLSGVGVAL